MLGPFATAIRLTPIHQVSLAVLSRVVVVVVVVVVDIDAQTACDSGGMRQQRHLVNGSAACGGSQWRTGSTFFQMLLVFIVARICVRSLQFARAAGGATVSDGSTRLPAALVC